MNASSSKEWFVLPQRHDLGIYVYCFWSQGQGPHTQILRSQQTAQHLAHSRYSTKICGMDVLHLVSSRWEDNTAKKKGNILTPRPSTTCNLPFRVLRCPGPCQLWGCPALSGSEVKLRWRAHTEQDCRPKPWHWLSTQKTLRKCSFNYTVLIILRLTSWSSVSTELLYYQGVNHSLGTLGQELVNVDG